MDHFKRRPAFASRFLKNLEVSNTADSVFVYLMLAMVIVSIFVFSYFLDYGLFLWLGYTEGSPVEILTALFYFFAGSILIGRSVCLLKRGRTIKTEIFSILFGLLFLFVAGEEVSWGQHIFHYPVPEKLKYLNQQSEWNLHNIDVFRNRYLTFDNLADFFVFFVGVFLPGINLFFFRARRFLNKIHFPVVPLSCLPLFFLGLAYVHVLNFAKIISSFETLEFKEFIFSLGFFLYAISVLTQKNSLPSEKTNISSGKK